MADTLVNGATAVDIPALVSGSAALRDPKVRDARAATLVADLTPPLQVALVGVPYLTTDSPLRCSWVLDDVLLAAYDPARLTADVVRRVLTEQLGKCDFAAGELEASK
jgi:hypothetical protein